MHHYILFIGILMSPSIVFGINDACDVFTDTICVPSKIEIEYEHVDYELNLDYAHVEILKTSIFNRRGELIWEGNLSTEKWNLKKDKVYIPSEVYIIQIEYQEDGVFKKKISLLSVLNHLK